MNKFSIAIHGGAGAISRQKMSVEKEADYKEKLKQARDAGYNVLEKGGTAVEAVETAVVVMEDSPLFNAGKGSVFARNGKHEMDAAIMDGKTLNAGAVALVSGVKNPVSLARKLMEKSAHVFLAGEGAVDFAIKNHCQMEADDYFFDELRHQQWLKLKGSEASRLDHSDEKDKKFGTVGAVALDLNGNIAAATSTGGMTNKSCGRIGDSPLIGAGTYANNRTCTVSCTGEGEYFIKAVAAYEVSALIEFKGLGLEEATKEVIHGRLKELGGKGGLIAIDKSGNISMVLNTEGMYRASRSSDGSSMLGIYRL